MSNKLFSGIMPAMITPINEDGTLKAASAEQIMKLELQAPIQGFYVNGATGEGPLLPEKTRREMAEIAVDVCRGRGVVINHIGAADAQSAFALAKHAREIGCDAISSVLPNFFFKFPAAQILDYYKRIADISGLPVLVYAQGLMNVDPVPFMKEAIKIDGVIGLKYTIKDYYDLHRITELNGGDINVINGPDETLICGLTMGADGGIGSTYNVMPEWFSELYASFRVGDFEHARQTQFKINRVIETLLSTGSVIDAVKAYFRMKGIDAGYAAYPAGHLTDEEYARIRREMIEEGIEL